MFQNKTTQKMKCKNLPMSISVRYSESLIPEVLPFVTGETKPCWGAQIVGFRFSRTESHIKGSKNEQIVPA